MYASSHIISFCETHMALRCVHEVGGGDWVGGGGVHLKHQSQLGGVPTCSKITTKVTDI